MGASVACATACRRPRSPETAWTTLPGRGATAPGVFFSVQRQLRARSGVLFALTRLLLCDSVQYSCMLVFRRFQCGTTTHP